MASLPKPSQCQINPANTLTIGRVLAVPMERAGGAPIDLLSGLPSTVTGSTLDWVQVALGFARDSNTDNAATYETFTHPTVSSSGGISVAVTVCLLGGVLRSVYCVGNPGSGTGSLILRAPGAGTSLKVQIFDGGNVNAVTMNTALTVGVPARIFVTFDGSHLNTYFDGSPNGSNTATVNNLNMLLSGLWISDGTFGATQGWIADFQVWNHVVSYAEIVADATDNFASYRPSRPYFLSLRSTQQFITIALAAAAQSATSSITSQNTPPATTCVLAAAAQSATSSITVNSIPPAIIIVLAAASQSATESFSLMNMPPVTTAVIAAAAGSAATAFSIAPTTPGFGPTYFTVSVSTAGGDFNDVQWLDP